MIRPDVAVVVGARPNFMKAAPVVRAIGEDPAVPSMLVHTGQHYDERMSRLFFEELGLPRPTIDLEVGSGSHAFQTARVLERFERVLLEHRPRLVVVVGDVNSTLACSLAAVKVGVAVAHVEAGLRSFDRTMPEEINRVLTDSIADLLFVTEPSGVENLLREGKSRTAIHLVGNSMIDTLVRHRDAALRGPILERLGLSDRAYAVLTLHRPANVDDPRAIESILDPVIALSRDVPVVFPVHPRTLPALTRFAGRLGGVRTLDALGYLDFLALIARARIVLTDSGGIQEETTILRVPCVTLRDNTERPITLTHGTNRLGGTTSQGIRSAITEAFSARTDLDPPPLWDGNAGARIGDVLRDWLAR